MNKYRINRKPNENDSPEQQEGEWLDTGLDVEAFSEEEALEQAKLLMPQQAQWLMASLYVL